MARFTDKVALLTGAASGVGRATAIRLAGEGAVVVGADVAEAGLAETAELVAEHAPGATFHGAVTDVTDRAACVDLVSSVVEDHGRLDVVGNIAGVTRIHHFTDATEAELDLMLAVNVKGPFYLSQAAVPHLLERAGAIVNVASNAGLLGAAYTVAYCVSKGGIVQLTRGMAVEYEKTSLRVNAVAPGYIRTPMTRNIEMPDDVDYSLIDAITPKRPGCEPDDIASAIAFLASDDARHVHGAILSVDDGLVAG